MHTSGGLVSFVQSIFLFAPSAAFFAPSNSGSDGICIFPGMRAQGKILAGVVLPVIIVLALGFVMAINFAIARLLSLRNIQQKLMFRSQVAVENYLLALVDLMTIVYTSLTLTPLQYCFFDAFFCFDSCSFFLRCRLIQCVQIGGTCAIFYFGKVSH